MFQFSSFAVAFSIIAARETLLTVRARVPFTLSQERYTANVMKDKDLIFYDVCLR
jgi:hypothetical protein